MRTLYKRLIVSAFLVSITYATIFFAPTQFFFLVVEIFILLALNEYFEIAEKKGIVINRVVGLLFGALLPFSIFYQMESLVLVLATLSIFISNFHPKFRQQALLSTAVTFFGIIYIAWFFSFLIKIRHLEHGSAWVFFTILAVKGGDAGAYFVGRKLGKTKLIEHISPNKSVEGAIGCFLTTILLCALSKVYLPHVAIGHLIIMGIVIGILSQFGDLAESLIKRDAGVKDSGMIPGLGGIFDVLDSLLLCIPFVYYYITAYPSLGQ